MAAVACPGVEARNKAHRLSGLPHGPLTWGRCQDLGLAYGMPSVPLTCPSTCLAGDRDVLLDAFLSELGPDEGVEVGTAFMPCKDLVTAFVFPSPPAHR